MTKDLLLGIDVGTTGTKTLLFSRGTGLIASAYRGYPLSAPRVGWSEQRAEDWWQAIVETVREVCGSEYGERVAAVSLSLQGGTVVPVDASGKALRPAMVWNDARAAEEKQKFLDEVGPAELMYQKTGWNLGKGLPALLIRWMKDNEPDIFASAAMFLTVPGYVSYKMTGIAAADLSDYGIDQLCDIRKGALDEDLMNFAGVREEQLAKVVRSGEIIGHLTSQAASELGLTEDAVLVAGAHDQYAVATGAGAMKNGDILIGSGTAWVVTALCNEPSFSSGLSQSVSAIPGMWGSLWSLSTGGVCLDWLRKNLSCAPDGTALDYESINREVAKRKAAEDGLFFYPFSGLCEGRSRFTKASLIGMDLSHDRFDIARAIMEGVTFQTLWMMESFKARPGKDGLKLAGGVSKSPVWCQMIADISNLPVRIPAVADLACVGAAILAGTGCGIYSDAADGYAHLAVADRVLLPDKDRAAVYAPLFEAYKNNAAKLGEVYELK